jgi:hypothetical protein
VKLSKQLHDFVLAWRFVPEAFGGLLPQLIHGPSPVHTAHDHVACRRKTMRTASRVIVDHIPAVATISMSID